jgi:ATP-binding cassette subfamily B protein
LLFLGQKEEVILKLVITFMKPYKKLLGVTLLLLVLDVAGALYIPTLAAAMLNEGVNGSTTQMLIQTGVKMAVASVVSSVGGLLSGYTCAVLSARIGKDMRDALYKQSLALSIHDFQQFGTASLTTRTIADITNIQLAIVNFIRMVLPVPIIFAIALSLSFALDVQVGLILLLVVVVVLLLAGIIMKKAAPLSKKLQKKLDKMSSVLLENITGVRVIRAFNKQKNENHRLNESFSDYASTAIKTNKMFASLDGLSFLALNFFIVLTYWLSGNRISLGSYQIGDITAIIEYALLILFYLMMAQMIILTMPRALECCRRVQAVLEQQPEITDAVPVKLASKEKTANILCFQNMTFRFSDAEEDTLSQLNFCCKRGETTAIIGGTGSGKSTIAMLIQRFYEVTQGAILVNDVDIKLQSQQELREKIAYVQQKAWLFSGTIAENLRYGNEQASDEELQHALTIAQASDFVNALPAGLNSRVAQGGLNFSGGQKQRLSIARALVKTPELYLFDDSFSALDFKTDAALRKALVNETKQAAVLIIAQRISTIQQANQIIVLDEGAIVGQGTHAELLKTNQVYQEIYTSQTKED